MTGFSCGDLSFQTDVEEMDLLVSARDFSLFRNQKRGIVKFPFFAACGQ